MHSIFNEKFIVKAAPFEVKSFLFKKKEKKKKRKTSLHYLCPSMIVPLENAPNKLVIT
jgi:hypothetical protein